MNAPQQQGTAKSPYQRAGFLAWFIFLLGLFTTIGLGSWQIHRLQWKQGLITKIESAQHAAPQAVIPTDAKALAVLEFTPFALSGKWIAGTEFHIAARYYQSKLGYHILQPFLLDDHRIAIVNRGWVPAALKDPATRPQTLAKGRANLVTTLRIGPDRNQFTPPSQPEKNMFFGRDIQQMVQSAGLDSAQVIDASFDIVSTSDSRELPIPFGGKIKLRNDHLSYVITWYLIAFFMVIIFWRYLRVSKSSQ
jgi:surfeit locus 1 family protein